MQQIADGGVAVMPPQKLIDILEVVRVHFNAPVTINSGYRCPVHNSNQNGAQFSRHMAGDAADFFVKGVSPREVYHFVEPMIGDTGGAHRYSSFVHIDVRGRKARW